MIVLETQSQIRTFLYYIFGFLFTYLIRKEKNFHLHLIFIYNLYTRRRRSVDESSLETSNSAYMASRIVTDLMSLRAFDCTIHTYR